MKARAFYMMYLTLMLILVSFLVGSFVRKAVTQKPGTQATVVKEIQPLIVVKPIDEFVLNDIFANDSELDPARVEALATLLNQHDIVAELTVYPNEKSSFEGALGRSATLLGALVRAGVSLKTVHAYASVRKTGSFIDVRLFHAA